MLTWAWTHRTFSWVNCHCFPTNTERKINRKIQIFKRKQKKAAYSKWEKKIVHCQRITHSRLSLNSAERRYSFEGGVRDFKYTFRKYILKFSRSEFIKWLEQNLSIESCRGSEVLFFNVSFQVQLKIIGQVWFNPYTKINSAFSRINLPFLTPATHDTFDISLHNVQYSFDKLYRFQYFSVWKIRNNCNILNYANYSWMNSQNKMDHVPIMEIF